jgi:hypothetical protein
MSEQVSDGYPMRFAPRDVKPRMPAEDRVIDIPQGSRCLDHLPAAPGVDVVIQLKRIQPYLDQEARSPFNDAIASGQLALIDPLPRSLAHRHSH